jgi:hypothetical protein
VPTDPLAGLAGLPGVDDAAAEARTAVDSVLWDRAARARGTALAAESTLVGAWCNSAFEGAEVLLDSLRAGAVEDSPMGRSAMRTLAFYSEIPQLADIVDSAPLQAFARMHSILAVGSVPDEELGRPRQGSEPDDPLRIGPAPSIAEMTVRLQAVAALMAGQTQAPALLLAGVVHAEMAVLRPFAAGSGVVARAMTRLILRARGVDPDGWTYPEAGMRMLGRPKYVAALRGYATGEPDAVAEWLVTHSRMVAAGARAAAQDVPALPED